jgi:hypothetical protein
MKGGYANAILNKNKPNETTNTQWSISNQGVASFNYIQANKGGKIGGWTIKPGTLTGTASDGGNKIILDANGGTIKAVNSDGTALWSIGRGGTASFNNNFYLSGTGQIQGTGSLSGSGMSMGAVGSTINPASVTVPDGGTLTKYISKLIVNDLDVCKNFQYNGNKVFWRKIEFVTGIHKSQSIGKFFYYT